MKEILERASKIKIVFTDCDGVLTDGGVYYGETGEVFKRFNIRDGMGVERLRSECNIETGIITGELSPSVATRAKKLRITDLHLGIKEKAELIQEIAKAKKISLEEIAYIGDDFNDLEIMKLVGFSACPSDAIAEIKNRAHFQCQKMGGHGCFRELAELIILSKKQE